MILYLEIKMQKLLEVSDIAMSRCIFEKKKTNCKKMNKLNSCEYCRSKHIKCDKGNPCSNCISKNIECVAILKITNEDFKKLKNNYEEYIPFFSKQFYSKLADLRNEIKNLKKRNRNETANDACQALNKRPLKNINLES